jgi:DNA repair protein RadD
MLELRRQTTHGRTRLVYACPTGGGKTVVAAAIVAASRPVPLLFVAHRIELIDQAVRQIQAAGVERVGVIRADDHRTDPGALVQVASKDTLVRRKLPPAEIVIIDECHRSMGAGYQRIIAGYPDALVIGLSATPWRLDGKPLGDTYEALVQTVQYSDLIANGSIVAPVLYSTRVSPDLSKVRTRQGDYAIDELETAMTDAQVVGSVVEEWRAHSGGRRSVVFACTVRHSQAIVSQFVAASVRAAHLDGETPLDERRKILADLEAGRLEVVSNVGVLCEGWDQPPVKCISLARPTQSLSLYMQMAGRSLRPWEGVVPVIIDHGRNVDRHGLPHEDRDWDLSAGVKPKAARAKLRTCPSCFAVVQKNPCEVCGFQTPIVSREVRVDETRALEKREQDPRVMFFERQLEMARRKGFKPGYAGAKFLEKFGSWPPWSWSERAKAAFASDEGWQQRQAARAIESAYWKEQNAKKQTETVETVDETSEERGAFDDLYH